MRDSDLDNLFAEARDATPLPSAGLILRVEAAGLAEQSARTGAAQRHFTPKRAPLWGRMARMFGGAGVTAGLATATLAGVWLGAAQPAALSGLTDSVEQAFGLSAYLDRLDLIPTFDPFATEG